MKLFPFFRSDDAENEPQSRLTLPYAGGIRRARRAQGMVEFALALPVFLLLVFGVIEFGRLLMTYSAVFSAAREAARYGAVAGTIEASGIRYDHDCQGMRDAAQRVGFMGGVTATTTSVTINLVRRDGTRDTTWCTASNSTKLTELGDLIETVVLVQFKPSVPLVPIGNVPVSSTASRTIIQNVDILGTPYPTAVRTLTHTPTFTPLPPTATLVPPTATVPPTYTLTINIVGGGSVAKNVDKALYSPGEVVNLVPTPGTGYTFSGWSGDLSGNENPKTITMNSNKTVTATFVGAEYTVTINVAPSGSGTVSGAGTYRFGDSVTIRAATNPGYVFQGWNGDIVDAGEVVVFTISKNMIINANFQFSTGYSLNINLSGSGSVNKSPFKSSYAAGEVVSLQAYATLGWTFVGWGGDLTSTANPATVTMNANKVITATFTQNEYSLTVNYDSNGGNVTRDQPGPYRYGNLVTLQAFPNPNYKFSGWSGAVSGSTNPNWVTIDGNKVVNAAFTRTCVLTSELVISPVCIINSKIATCTVTNTSILPVTLTGVTLTWNNTLLYYFSMNNAPVWLGSITGPSTTITSASVGWSPSAVKDILAGATASFVFEFKDSTVSMVNINSITFTPQCP